MIAKTSALFGLTIAAALSSGMLVFGAPDPDGIAALVLGDRVPGSAAGSGTLVFRLDWSTTALEVRLLDLAEDGIALVERSSSSGRA